VSVVVDDHRVDVLALCLGVLEEPTELGGRDRATAEADERRAGWYRDADEESFSFDRRLRTRTSGWTHTSSAMPVIPPEKRR